MFKLLDRLVWKEMLGPWLFGVAMFSVVLMAGTYLFRLTDYLVKGVPPMELARLTALYMPGLVAKTFPMAVLLSSLLAFARLSNDSEIIAAQTGGASLFRIVFPVATFGLSVSMLAFIFGEVVVPQASFAARALTEDIMQNLRKDAPQPFSQTLYIDGKFAGQLMAKDIDLGSGQMHDAVVVWWGNTDRPETYFFIEQLEYVPGEPWKATGIYAIARDADGGLFETTVGEARPPFGRALDFTPRSILSSSISDNDAFSMADIRKEIDKLQAKPNKEVDEIREMRDKEVGYWTKLSLPLSSIVFALVGAPVSIRRVRQSVGIGVGISIAIIFAYYLLHNYMSVLAKAGVTNPAFSAFLPVAVGLAAAIMLLIQKNR
ncbi:MAG: LptF/LptG family permease [Armatimonadota bacterium]|nr:LptF/LptG family permease [Armatimonadota bacterium]